MRRQLTILGAAAWVGAALAAGLAHGEEQGRVSAPPPGHPSGTHPSTRSAGGRLSAEDAAAFESRFQREIWPLMERAGEGCVSCHNAGNPSQLHFAPDGAEANFKKLLSNSFFEPENPGGILSRIASPLKERRMPPPPLKAWTDDEIARVRSFVTDLFDKAHTSQAKADEQFPAELQDPYTGKRLSAGPDNTFLTYWQLRAKIKTLFGDDWKRGERDLFQENVAQFNGADFIKRFDESSKPSATFLSALDTMSRDVASRAYLESTGPFAGRAQSLPSPLSLKAPNPAYRAEIGRLYRTMLFRSPSETELRQAFQFIKQIYAARASVARVDSTLDLELDVQDGAGRTTSRAFRLPVNTDSLGVYQEFVDEGAPSEQPLVKKSLGRAFTFKQGGRDQRLEISNQETSGNVSIAGVEVKGPLPKTDVKKIDVSDPSVSVQGAWRRRDDNGFASYEDGNNNQGSSRIRIPIAVPADGKYEVTLLWRKAGAPPAGRGRRRNFSLDNAALVPVEVFSLDPPALANPPLPPLPPKGEAHFVVDETLDTIGSWDLKSAFRFGAGPNQGVEINNLGTKKRVVADAVKFVPAETGAEPFVMDDPQAEGGWPAFKFPSFRPFNLVGTGAVSDNNESKGELHLLYRPSKASEWKAGREYRVLLVFPGQVDNETRVPVTVRAEESTPIVQMSAPLSAEVGATVTLDASTTYNLQRTPLRFTWRQFGGPRVRFSDPHAPKVTFKVEPASPQQAAWEGLCRALMKHPDFLFTRPRSLALVRDPKERRHLLLVKIAQDLVGRPPSHAEVREIDRGVPVPEMIDRYLGSQEFRDFYLRRVRLVLESQGSDMDDEPARLWGYVAFNNRPFKEILTADYTVDKDLRKQPRPAYYGKTGLLTMKGFVKGKPGLPHFNYAAQVCEKFLGYVFEVPPSIVAMRDAITAASTTSPTSVCYSCHKVLTPLAYQRTAWTDDGEYQPKQDDKPVDDTDRGLVPSYPFRGKGMEAFATRAVNKERFIRTMFQTHFVWYFGREMRYQDDERRLYKRLWDDAAAHNYSIRSLLHTLMTSPEYLNGPAAAPATSPPRRSAPGRVARR